MRNGFLALVSSTLFLAAGSAAAQDSDLDGIPDVSDNCQFDYNTDQEDSDSDGAGEVCDCCRLDPASISGTDADADRYCESCAIEPDNCPGIPNDGQSDEDDDGVGDACDICPFDADPGQVDTDNDGVGDACDVAPGNPDPPQPQFSAPFVTERLLDRDAGSTADGIYATPELLCTQNNEYNQRTCDSPDSQIACANAGGTCQPIVVLGVVDLAERKDVQDVQFEVTGPDPGNAVSCGSYSFLGVDNDPSLEDDAEVEPSLFPDVPQEENSKFGRDGWNFDWIPPGGGLYCLRATMTSATPIGPASASDEILVYVDDVPSIPQFLNVTHMQRVSGVFPFELAAPDTGPVNITFYSKKTGKEKKGFDQTAAPATKQSLISPNATNGFNANCGPAAAANGLSRLAAANPGLLIDGDVKKTAMKLVELMKTTLKAGTHYHRLGTGIIKYLKARNQWCRNPNGYKMRLYKQHIGRETVLGMAKKREFPGKPTWGWADYEREMRKGQTTILLINPWTAGPNGKYGDKDDVMGFGHFITGTGGEMGRGNPAPRHTFRFRDPATGGLQGTSWMKRGGYPSIVYMGKIYMVHAMFALSPKKPAQAVDLPGAEPKELKGAGLIPNGGVNTISFPVDTDAMDEGIYLGIAMAVDADGNFTQEEVVFEIDRDAIPSLPTALLPVTGVLIVGAAAFATHRRSRGGRRL